MIVAGIIVASTVLFETHNTSLQSLGSQQAQAQQPQSIKVPFTLHVPNNHIVLKAGQSTIIPIDIYATPRALQAKLSVTLLNDHLNLIHGKQAKLPLGISATLDKNAINLPKLTETGTGISKRDNANLTLSVSQNTKSGMYNLTVVMFEADGRAFGIPLYVEVR